MKVKKYLLLFVILLMTLSSLATINISVKPVQAQTHKLTVQSTPFVGINFTINATSYTTNMSGNLPEGFYTVTMPSTWVNGTDQYNFVKWEDNSTDPVRGVDLTSAKTIIAFYQHVKVYVDQPLGYIPGVAPGGKVTIDIIIEVNGITENSTDGIIGWGFHVQVDPDVLNLTKARAKGATAGYFLYDFADYYWYDIPTLLGGSANATTGYWRDISEQIMPFPAGGAGDPWNGSKLVTLEFTSNNATAYSKIDLIGVAIFPQSGGFYYASETIDGHYNQPPPNHNLTVQSTPIDGIDFKIDSTTYTTNTTVELQEGKPYTVTMPSTWVNGTDQYNFVKWEDDSTNRVREVSLTADKTITATYELATQNYTLTVNSVPISGVNFTIGSTTYTTNTSVSLLEGTYTVTMPSTWTVGTDRYLFRHWEDNSTRVRDVSLTSNKTITATYELAKNYTLTVNSVPISGVNFTIEYRVDLMPYTATGMTNQSVSLLEGITYTIKISSAWTVDTDLYLFTKWEDDSTNRVREVSLTSNKTITATYQIPYVKVYVDQPLGYIPGQPPNETVTFDIIIEISNITDNSGAGIVGWGLDLQVDPNVIDISNSSVTAGTAGYLLYNFSDYYGYSSPTLDSGTTNATTGYWNDISNQIAPTPSGGAGDSWSGLKLVTISFTSKNETAYSKIDILEVSYKTASGKWYPVDEVIDGHYNKPYILTVQSTPIDGIDFTIDTTTYTTNQSIGFLEGNYTVTMPSTWTVGTDQYNFVKWEDNSTNPVRAISLTSNITITATYVKLVPPVASFTFSPTEPIVNETVTFNASASEDPDGTIVSYAWDFGDGESGSGAIVEHTYTTAGTYNVTLTVTDNDDLTHTITKTITVKEAPSPGIPPEILYVIAAAVIGIIVIAVVVYYLKVIKSKPT